MRASDPKLVGSFVQVDIGLLGKIRPVVDSVYAFEDALSAYARLLTSRATGKVVVKVDPTVG